MLPYLAQGANSSLEDGAVLGRLLKYVTSRDKLPAALDLYQQLRKARGEGIAKEALGQVNQTTPKSVVTKVLTDVKEGLVSYA